MREVGFPQFRDGLENSSYHKQQLLGRKSQYALRMKLPPMKSDFISRKNFFKKRPSMDIREVTDRKPQGADKLKPTDKRGTNTLTYTYSETVVEGNSKEQKPPSEYNTVFKFTDRHSKGGEEEDLVHDQDELVLDGGLKSRHSVPTQLTKSQNLAKGRASFEEPKQMDNISKSNFLDSKVSQKDQKHVLIEEPHDLSEHLGEKELKEIFERKQKLIPEYMGVCLQFYTEAIYCTVTSLCLIRDGVEYDIPFAIAKIVLRSKGSLAEFINHCHFNRSSQVLDMDFLNLEELKNMPVIEEQDFETDFLDVKGTKITIQ